MHCVKRCYIDHGAHVQAAISVERMSNVNRIHNVNILHPDQMTLLYCAIQMLIVMNPCHVIDLVNALIRVKVRHSHVNQIKNVKHDDIDRYAYANLVLLLMNMVN